MHEIEQLFRLAYAKKQADALYSPPDVFAVCCTFAKVTGVYRRFSEGSSEGRRMAVDQAKRDGASWRKAIDQHQRPTTNSLPTYVVSGWEYIGTNCGRPIEELVADEGFISACLYLIIAADEASVGVGIPSQSNGGYFELDGEARILDRGTLCRFIPSHALRVLPKQHTPQSGFNIRSLTHHLALLNASEVEPRWTITPNLPLQHSSFNVLMAPWPLEMNASDIHPAVRRSQTKGFGYFDYQPKRDCSAQEVKRWVQSLLSYAENIGQKVDLLLFPECSLNVEQWRAVSKVSSDNGAFAIAGVRGDTSKGGVGENTLRIKVPLPWYPELVQYKHHRWQIDPSQLTTYGLGGTLGADTLWWENIGLPERALRFLATSPELVLCPLICEDLARQDPVAELVRSVGPNLVIALLMDGPQLPERWAARYASVLADDPGSSVLTITSLGMVRLSRPNNCRPSRIIGSWKDPFGRFTSLELAENETALILNLQFRKREESTVDGRTDGGVASTPVLCGVHPITL